MSTFYRQDRETGEVSMLTEAELRNYLEAHRASPEGTIEEMRGGLVIDQTFFSYAANAVLFPKIVRKLEGALR